MKIENKISKARNILVVLWDSTYKSNDLDYLIAHFCGIVVRDFSEIQTPLHGGHIYVCGDMDGLKHVSDTLFVIKELSIHYENYNKENTQLINLGGVPILISNAGVYYRNLFEDVDFFNKVKSEHEFQELTESNKESTALRKGIYLSQISKEETENKEEAFHFHLLRCSSNLTGPTDNFRNADHQIIQTLNNAVKATFEEDTTLNHVLAQIYQNKKKTEGKAKEVKAKIGAHSDKTKDMPKDGVIAFCTFYDSPNFEHLKPSKSDKYDWCYKDTSGLTKLHFKRKSNVMDDTLEKEFSVTLYPNSAFLIPLSTNRLYTHAIRPSALNIDKIPIRMGYVVRCSNLEAVHINAQTYIKEKGELVKLEQMTPERMEDLRDSYYQENKTEQTVEYGKIHFSMNSGDYVKPIY